MRRVTGLTAGEPMSTGSPSTSGRPSRGRPEPSKTRPEQLVGEGHLHGPAEEPDPVAGGDALRAGEDLQADLVAFEADDLRQRGVPARR